ncbi:MAG: MMPL family transporter [Naasia sp.]
MATLLYRIGLWTYHRPWRVIAAWVLILAALGTGALSLGGSLKNSYAIPGTESQQAIDKLEAVFPQTAGATVQIVLQAPEGDDIAVGAPRDAVEATVSAVADVDGVESAVDPFSEYAVNAVSDDGRVAIVQVTLAAQSQDVSTGTLDAIQQTATIGEDAGLTVAYAGQVFQDVNVGLTVIELFGVLFAAVVLIITFGSLLAAGMPLLIALAGVGIALSVTLIVAAFTAVSTTAPLLALMIGLAVGIDYSLFIVSRHRNQLATGMDPRTSAGTAIATSGSAVVFAGLTVIIALLGLLIVGIPFLSIMGLTAAVAVLVAVFASITLLPAVLGLAKGRLAPRIGGRAHRRALAQRPGSDGGRPSIGTRWVRLVLKAPVIPVILVVGALGALVLPASQLQLGLPDNGSDPRGTTQREAYDIVADSFGAGRNGPLIVLVDITQTTDVLADLEDIGQTLAALDDVSAVGQGIPNATVDTAIIQVIPDSGPTSPETTALVERIRELAPDIERTYGTPVAVTGATAVAVDISSTLADALIPFAAIVVGLSVLLLMMVFRSLFVPLTAALGFVLSLIAAFGATVLVFQLGYGADLIHVEAGPILSFLPIILIAVLFGLAMDYQVFLVSGMREEYVRTGRARESVEAGFSHAARVVTAAALIMFFVFFAFVPEGAGVIKAIAFGLAAGVFFDAFLVRMTLIPALMAIAGRHAWYLPRWLGRLLPNVDIEGESLGEHRAGAEWAEQQGGAAVSAERLVVAGPRRPLDFSVQAGGFALLAAEEVTRRALAAVLAGRAAPLSGHAQVQGRALPGDARRASRAVALVDPDAVGADAGLRIDDLIRERLVLAEPIRRAGHRRQAIGSLLEGASRAVAANGGDGFEPDARAGSLHPDGRVAVGVALALASGASVLVVDLGDAVGEELERQVRIIDALVPAHETVIVGVARASSVILGSGRPLALIDLDRKTVLS